MTAEPHPTNLPGQLTGFVGRQAEVAEVRALLDAARMVTLIGTGGVGKTRLAMEVAATQVALRPGGVRWVELATVTDPAQVGEAVAAAVQVLVEPRQGPARSLAAQLRDRGTLICLDNCEHVLDAVAELAGALLRSCPGTAVLATSREPLAVPGEVVWRVPSLSADEAKQLFVERGRQVRHEFTLDDAGAAATSVLCSRLDGIPLAIELAASWLRTLTPQQIEQGLDDRFGLLIRSPRGVAARQQTLAASIAWSHDLLDELDRAVFRRLAVFPAGFDLDAARAVCADGAAGPGDVLGSIGRLVDKSLVVADTRGGTSRYGLLETIREYAADRLRDAGEGDRTRDRHLDHFLAVATARPVQAGGLDSWRARVEREYDNLRAALEWGLAAPDPERGRRLAAELAWLWHLNRHGREGILFLHRAIDHAPTDRGHSDRTVLQARLLTGLALVADTASPLDLEYDVAQRALELATAHGDDGLRSQCLTLSAVGLFYTDFDASWELAVEAGEAAGVAGDRLFAAAPLALRGMIRHHQDRHDEARPLLEAALVDLRDLHRGIGSTTLAYLSEGALVCGRLAAARDLAEQALDLAQPLGDFLRVGIARSALAAAHTASGNLDAAHDALRPLLALVEPATETVFVPGLTLTLAQLHVARGDLDAALRGYESGVRQASGAPTYLAARLHTGHGEALRRAGRADDARRELDRAVELARGLGMPRVLADALEQQALLRGDLDLHHESLTIRVDHGLRTSWTDALDAIAPLLPDPNAARAIAACTVARAAMGHPRTVARQRDHDELVGRLQQGLGPEFATAWAAGSTLTLDDAVAYVRRNRGANRRATAGWASLTPTELSVLQLAAAGLNNPQIGARLFISRSTVKTHLAHIYAKLGVANRTELAALSRTAV
ncbi:helix-turn-helix transcriptional regulator [Pseudonocardia sp. TRM90224]|uniref:helix-turn-helix transcriptional regulator n=1 Tax=Pseudonocardia sp. TRM90224 TaxID=2812678 RepID=UPI001E4E24B1|nr:LuxR C-terminal-related transcriptional regulator [Pseudonocardia sp. TRM90224]